MQHVTYFWFCRLLADLSPLMVANVLGFVQALCIVQALRIVHLQQTSVFAAVMGDGSNSDSLTPSGAGPRGGTIAP